MVREERIKSTMSRWVGLVAPQVGADERGIGEAKRPEISLVTCPNAPIWSLLYISPYVLNPDSGLTCRLGVKSDFGGGRGKCRGTDRPQWPEREAMDIESLRTAVAADPRDRGEPRGPNETSHSGALEATTPC